MLESAPVRLSPLTATLMPLATFISANVPAAVPFNDTTSLVTNLPSALVAAPEVSARVPFKVDVVLPSYTLLPTVRPEISKALVVTVTLPLVTLVTL